MPSGAVALPIFDFYDADYMANHRRRRHAVLHLFA